MLYCNKQLLQIQLLFHSTILLLFYAFIYFRSVNLHGLLWCFFFFWNFHFVFSFLKWRFFFVQLLFLKKLHHICANIFITSIVHKNIFDSVNLLHNFHRFSQISHISFHGKRNPTMNAIFTVNLWMNICGGETLERSLFSL